MIGWSRIIGDVNDRGFERNMAVICAFFALLVSSGRSGGLDIVSFVYILLSAFFATLATWVGTEV